VADFTPDPGQWVVFKAAGFDHPEAHKTADGYFVGIFHPGGKDVLGEYGPPRVMLVDAEGHNVPVPAKQKDGSHALANLCVPLAGADAVHPAAVIPGVTEMQAADTADLPPKYVGNPIRRPARVRK
jgi:hypothetical protein